MKPLARVMHTGSFLLTDELVDYMTTIIGGARILDVVQNEHDVSC